MAKLTKAQWLKGPRKSGTYAAYVKWWNRTQRLPSSPYAPWSAAQQRAETNRRVEDILRPLRQQAQQEAAQRALSIREGAKATNAILQSHVGQTQGIYNKATEELKSVGAPYSAAFAARIQGAQDAAAQFAASQGAPATPGPAGAVDTQAFQDVGYHTGVAIPAANLVSEGAAASAEEAQLAGIPLIQGERDVRQSQQEYEKQLLEIAQKRPELADQIAQKLFENEMAKLDARIKVQAQAQLSAQFGETVRHHRVGEQQAATRNRLSRLRYDLQVQTHQDAMDRAAAENRYPNASLSRAYGYIVDKFGHPILDKNGKKIPVAKSNSAKSKKEKSNAQYQKAVGEAAKMFKDSRITHNEFGEEVVPKRLWRWGNAMRYLMNRYGIKRAAARRALISAGFKPPRGSGAGGQSGNPGGTAAATPNYGGRGGQ